MRCLALLCLLLFAAPAAAGDAGRPLDWAAIPLPGLDGEPLDPAVLQGRPVLVVNTASRCGFTPQYEGLQALWERYRDQGLVVLGVPANDFGGQEPGSRSEIADFCEVAFGIDFPMLDKQVVTGAGAHPIYLWAAAVGGSEGVPRWNFHKLLVGPDGRFLAGFPSGVTPEDPALVAAAEAAIAAQ